MSHGFAVNISVGPVRTQDFDETVNLLDVTIRNTFKVHGIDKSHAADMKHEVGNQVEFVRRGLTSRSRNTFFFVARSNEKIIGTIGCGGASDLVRQHLTVNFARVPEIKSVYVLPDYQRSGVGSELFRAMLLTLRREQVDEFCLDCGYRKSQWFWQKLIGDPTITLHHHWGDNAHHMIWRRSVGDVLSSLGM